MKMLTVCFIFFRGMQNENVDCFIFFRVLYDDDENCLTSVILFRRAVDEFKHKCRENR